MTLTHDPIQIAGDAPGHTVTLSVFRAGPTDAPAKIYLQAALHADEQPGIIALHHLLPLIAEADAAGRLKARVVIVPMANPLGMGQMLFQSHSGRYDFRSGVNFNRRWPDLFAAVADDIAPRLTSSAVDNLRLVRKAVREWIARQSGANALQRLRLAIMAEACDADCVLDLHCDDEALTHLFVTPDSMQRLGPLADWMGSVAQLTAEDSGGGSFDEVWPSLWTRLRAAHPDHPIPMGAIAATLEYRGQADVSDSIGHADALGLYRFMVAMGWIDDALPATPEPAPAPTPLAATEMLRVEAAGLLAYRVPLGAVVAKGDVIADLIALDGPDAFVARTPIRAGTAGRVISRNQHKYVIPGASIAKIVGTVPLPGREGYLLED